MIRLAKFAAEPRAVQFDFGLTAAVAWMPDAFIASGALRRPRTAAESPDGADHSTGYLYQASGAGQTGASEPAWPATGTVTDGSVSWTPVAPGSAGEDVLTSVTWTPIDPPDDALQVTDETFTGLTASAVLTGGTSNTAYIVEITGIRESGGGKTIRLAVAVV